MATKPTSKSKKAPVTKIAKVPDRVEFHYIKSPFFRSVHVDGVIGGITPRGLIHMAVFSERPAIPTKSVLEVLPSGQLGDEVRELREGKDGFAREMEMDLFMGLDTARQIVLWFQQRIGELEVLREKADGTVSPVTLN